MLFLKAYATSGGGKSGQNRKGSGNNKDMNMPKRNGNQSMSQYYRNGGVTRLGGNARTRGRQASINRVG